MITVCSVVQIISKINSKVEILPWLGRLPQNVEVDDISPNRLYTLTYSTFIMAALCNRGALYFCPVVSFYLLLLSSSSSFFRRLISAAADWMSTIYTPHMVWP